uniref:Transposase, mutator type n=1 Tax=Tanacetum cinerariifolium TaxID=118510 RepID=A0A6L2M5Q4_TANCI|nr:transposase, mutator type [Tanacetum cinerariifolium]
MIVKLELAKYVKNSKIILVNVENGRTNVESSIFVTPKKKIAIAVDNHLRKTPIEIDSSLDVNRNLTPMCHRNLTKVWEKVSSKELSIETDDPFDDLDEILGDYANIRKEINRKDIIVHVGNNFMVENVVDYDMLYETEGVGPMGNFKEVEVDTDNETKKESVESDIEENDTRDLDYDPKHDDDEHILEDVPISMDNFNFSQDPKHDLSIVDVHKHDLDVIDYDSFGSDLDDGINSKRITQLRELRRISKAKNHGPNKYYCYLGKKFATKEIVNGRVKKHLVETKRKLILVKKDKERVGVKCEGTIPALVHFISSDTAMGKNMKAFKAKRNARDKMIGSFKEHYSMVREYAQELINQNPSTTVRIDVKQEPNPESLKRTLEGCPFPGQILTKTQVDANNEIYPVAYVISEAKSKASLCWFLNLLGEDLGKEVNYNYTFISDSQKGLIQAIASVFPSAKHRDMWLVVESRTIIILPIHKPQVGRPPKKRKKPIDELVSQRKAARVKMVQVKLVVLVNKVKLQDQLLSQGPKQGAGAKNASSQAADSS